jgi:antagonist of KipI
MSITIKRPGILTTVQDLGRHGFNRFGVNPGGACDRAAARILNTLLGNEENAAVIETHFPAVELVFDSKKDFSVGGADFIPTLNGKEIQNWRVYTAAKGDTLKFKGKRLGSRAYLAVKGGFKVAEWLGSSSTNLLAAAGGFEGRPLKSGDIVKIARADMPFGRAGKMVSFTLIPRYSTGPTVRVIEGGESGLVGKDTWKTFESSTFTITQDSDRMGYRLRGPALATKRKYEMVTSAATFGTVQLLPDGQLVVLMADHQTTGGYPRIATVLASDLPLLAQLGPGDKIRFESVPIEEAEKAMAEFEKDLRMLRLATSAR